MEQTYAAELLAVRRHLLGQENPETIAVAADLALAYRSQGKFVEAEPLAREALDFSRRKQPDDWRRFRAESLLGASLAGERKYAEAEPLLVEGYQGMVARKEAIAAGDRDHLNLARKWLVQLYESWGKPEKAAASKQQCCGDQNPGNRAVEAANTPHRPLAALRSSSPAQIASAAAWPADRRCAPSRAAERMHRCRTTPIDPPHGIRR